MIIYITWRKKQGFRTEHEHITSQAHMYIYITRAGVNTDYKMKQVHKVGYSYMVTDRPQIHGKNTSTAENTQYVIQYL